MALMLIGLVIVSVLLTARSGGLFVGMDLRLYDLQRRLVDLHAFEPRIVIVEITEQDIRAAEQWPFSDQVLAQALERILAAKPRVVGLDLYRDLRVPPGSGALDKLFAQERRIVGITKLDDGAQVGVPPHPQLAGSERVGFNDLLVDDDGVVRRGLLFVSDANGDVHFAFALRLALLYLAAEGVVIGNDPANPNAIRLGNTALPPLESESGGYVGADAGGYQLLIDYTAGRHGLERLNFGDLLAGDLSAEQFNDRVVLIGSNAHSVSDTLLTPIGPFSDRAVGFPGVAVHAQIAAQLIRNGLGESVPMAELSEWWESALVLAVVCAGVLLGAPLRGVFALTTVLTLGWLLLAVATVIAFHAALWIPVAVPAAAWLLALIGTTAYMAGRERAQRHALLGLFASHLSPSVARALWEQRHDMLVEGRPRPLHLPVTFLFVDMKGYTRSANAMSPDQLMHWVNEFMEAQSEQIYQHGGVVDDYFGDGIKANFGVPFPRRDEEAVAQDAANAVRCALAMASTLTTLNRRWREGGLPTVQLRIGIHTGEAVAACLGSRTRLKYTTVGADVIVAQRLESLRELEHDYSRQPARILISQSTHDRLDGAEFDLTPLGALSLSGIEQPLPAYRVDI